MVAPRLNFVEGRDNEITHRLRFDGEPEVQAIWELLDKVKDPEIPVLSIWDLGILRDIRIVNEEVIVTVTPTYSGCPAMDVIRSDIKSVLAESGYPDCEVETVLSPAWTTDWMSEEGRQKLEQFGIAPPAKTTSIKKEVCCPRCKSENTRLISEFGSTACKAMYQCVQCKEAFCYFKII
ncbi:MAG: ring-1,2-phenylacetyl-CoA epoxidase subunit PaaD [Gammaproteobacteria bacterium]|jgi:ring-1,2-phenylacetyl-CoA epoxidase subunit PaaD